MSRNQRLNATITVGSVLDQSVRRNVGVLRSGLGQVAESIRSVETRQRELGRQRQVLVRQGQSVEQLDREYADLTRTMVRLKLAQDRYNRAASASRRVGATWRNMQQSVRSTTRAITVGSALAAGAVFGLANSTAVLGDNVAKTADTLGIGIVELQEMRYAAERAGVTTETFDSALEKMVKNLGEASMGTGTATDALDALGLSADALANMAPDEALGAIAEAMADVENQAQRASLANDIFGRSGVGLLNMLRDGRAGLDEMRIAAQRTGYVLSEEAARDAEVFQDTLLDTRLTLQGLKNTLGADLMPVVTRTMRSVGDMLISNRAEVQEWSVRFAAGVERIVPLVGELFKGLVTVSTIVWDVASGTADMVGGWENFGIVIGAVLASRTIFRIGAFALAVGRLGFALVGVARSTPLVVGGIRAIGAAMLANPIGIAIALIAAGAALIYKNWEAMGPWFGSLWDGVKGVFSGFTEFVSGVFTGDIGRAWDGIMSMWDGYASFFTTFWSGVGSVFTATWENVIKPVTDALGITEPLVAAWTFIGDRIGAAVELVGSVFDRVWTAMIEPVIDGLRNVGGLSAIWDGVKTSVGSVVDYLGERFSAVWELIRPVIDALKWGLDNGRAAANALGIGDGGSVMDGRDGQTGDPSFRPPGSVLGNRLGRGPLDTPTGYARGGTSGIGMRMVGEAGPELEFKNRSAYVATHQRFARLSEVADKVFARPSGSRSTGGADSGGGNVPQSVNITINAQGASAAEVASLVARQQRRAAAGGLHDGFGG
jgi:hypothetical protein